MNKIGVGILCGILLLTACGQTVSAVPTAPISESETSIVLKKTSSPLPSKTPREPRNEPTNTITPLPAIPTFTPTFDASTIITVTPAPKAECPTIKNDVNINLSNFDDYYPELVTALNQGAPIEAIIDIFEKKFDQHYYPDGNISFHEKINYEIIDVTNDGTPEIILPGNAATQKKAVILGCGEGEYKILFSRKYLEEYMHLLPVDANQNGITEIIIGDESGTSTGAWFEVSIIEWHIDSFQELLTRVYSSTAFRSVRVKDLDNDKTKEVYWRFGAYIFSIPPWRRGTAILKWNGNEFILMPLNYDPAQYRFQAIQDGDTATLDGHFIEAIKSYQEAIFNKKLEWWSSQRQNDTIFKIGHEGFSAVGTPALGNPEPSEYPSLAAYAYYRIMLLHIVQGHESDADTVYKTLQQKFSNDQYGQPYVEMAIAFWNAYQSTHKMYDGCAAAIQYAVEHPEMLTPLGSDYHGAQSHIYMPADVCPFR
jgi:hypothetical protein